MINKMKGERLKGKVLGLMLGAWLLCAGSAHADFSAAGVQTGADADSSGLAGVTNNNQLTLTGDATVTFYQQTAGTLTIQGDWTVDSWSEKILTGAATGNPGVNVTTGSLTITGSGEAFIDTKEGADFTPSNSSIQVGTGAAFTASDCVISTARNVTLLNNGSNPIRINGTTFRKLTTDAVQVVRFDFSGTPDAIVDCRLDGIGGLMTGVGTFTGIEILNGGSIDSNHNLQSGPSVYGIGNENADFSNIQFAGNIGSFSLKLRNDNTMTIRGFDLPMDQIGVTGRLALGGSDQGAVFYERAVKFNISDAAGSVVGAQLRVTDERGAGDTFATPETYSYVTGNDGSTATQSILLGVVNALNATDQAGYDNVESYGEGDVMTAPLTAHIHSYLHTYTTQPFVGVGLGELAVVPAPLGVDGAITEPDKAVARAYETQETSARANDHLKAIWEEDAPSSDVYVSLVGDVLDFGSRDVTVAVGSGESVVTATSISINVSALFTGSMVTTGTVTGKGLITGSVIDSTQDTTLSEAVGTVFSVYGSEADANMLTNAIVSDVTSWGTLLSTVPNGGTVYVRAGLDGIVSVQAVTLVAGQNSFAVGLAAELGGLLEGLKIINENVKDASLSIPASREIK